MLRQAAKPSDELATVLISSFCRDLLVNAPLVALLAKNLIYREDERELIPVAEQYGVSRIPYSPLAGGHLSHRGWESGTKRSDTDKTIRNKYDHAKENDLEIIERVSLLAQRLGVSMSQVAPAWQFKRGVAAPIVGATNIKHFDDAVNAVDLTLSQEMLLPEGEYTLTADVWKSGLGGDVFVNVVTQDGASLQAPSLENKEEWQQVALTFESDGLSSTTIQLSAMHNYNGSEKIIGFDNVVLTSKGVDAIGDAFRLAPRSNVTTDLLGRNVTGSPHKGVYLRGNKKFVVK